MRATELTLSADYMRPILVDVAQGGVALDSLGLSKPLIDAIEQWNRDYQPIIQASLKARRQADTAIAIAELNRTGLELARRVAAACPEAKVGYCSEGLLSRLPLV